MDKLNAILQTLKSMATDIKVWLRIVVLAIVFFGGAILYSKTKVKADPDCARQRADLINALIEIKRDLETPATSQVPITASFRSVSFIEYDTIPKSPQVIKVLSKIDSILYKIKVDSLKKTKT